MLRMTLIKKILFLCFLFINLHIDAQNTKDFSFSIGTNLLKIPPLTFDIIYDYKYKPYLDFTVNTGYGFNYNGSNDLSRWLTGMCKGGNDGYLLEKQSGPYLKLGIKANTRKNFNTKYYFFVGSYIANSFIYEKALSNIYWNIGFPINSANPYRQMTHNLYIFGVTGFGGFSFIIYKKISCDIGLEIGFPSSKYKELYGYENFIPGIGTKANTAYWFPQLLLNLKYDKNNVL